MLTCTAVTAGQESGGTKGPGIGKLPFEVSITQFHSMTKC